MPPPRKIIHIDMDAFYAAVEQRDFPEYRSKALIVGGSPYSRGVVATCSYDARAFGVHSAMAASRALRLCPQAIFVRPRFDVYKQVSLAIRQIFYEFTDLVEPLSLDEAYLDVTDAGKNASSATLIAKEIKNRIKKQLELTASAGVSYNKFLAKIASDINKPDGFYLIRPEQGVSFIEQLPIHKFHGVGRATAHKMHALGITNGKGLKSMPLEKLQEHFGKSAAYYYDIARGIDHRPVVNVRKSQSIGAETTFQEDIQGAEMALAQLEDLFAKVLTRVNDKNLVANTLTVKVKYHDFVQITRSRTLSRVISDSGELRRLIPELLRRTDAGRRAVRLLGVTLSSFQEKPMLPLLTRQQTDLFDFR